MAAALTDSVDPAHGAELPALQGGALVDERLFDVQVVGGQVGAFGSSSVALNSGTLANSIGANSAIANPISFNNSVVTFANNRTFFTGPITLDGTLNLESVGAVKAAGKTSLQLQNELEVRH